MNKLYLISQEFAPSVWYNFAVVCARSAREAKFINPNGCIYNGYNENAFCSMWANPEKIIVREIWIANSDIEPLSIVAYSYICGKYKK